MLNFSFGRMRPPSFGELSVLGCAAVLVFLALAGLALYVCIRTGFGKPEAVRILVFSIIMLAGLWAVHNWVERQF